MFHRSLEELARALVDEGSVTYVQDVASTVTPTAPSAPPPDVISEIIDEETNHPEEATDTNQLVNITTYFISSI